MIKDWFDYRKRKNLFILGIVVLALNAIVWSRGWLQGFLGTQIIWELDVATLIGLAMLWAVWLFHEGKKLG